MLGAAGPKAGRDEWQPLQLLALGSLMTLLLLLLLSCIPVPVCSANAAGASHYFMWLSQNCTVICVSLGQNESTWTKSCPPTESQGTVWVFWDAERYEERPCSWRMGTELGDGSAIAVALNRPRQSHRVGWMLLLGWNQLLWSLLPFSCWAGWERDLCGWGHLSPLLLLSLPEGRVGSASGCSDAIQAMLCSAICCP